MLVNVSAVRVLTLLSHVFTVTVVLFKGSGALLAVTFSLNTCCCTLYKRAAVAPPSSYTFTHTRVNVA